MIYRLFDNCADIACEEAKEASVIGNDIQIFG